MSIGKIIVDSDDQNNDYLFDALKAMEIDVPERVRNLSGGIDYSLTPEGIEMEIKLSSYKVDVNNDTGDKNYVGSCEHLSKKTVKKLPQEVYWVW